MKSKHAGRVLVSCVIFLGGLIGNVNGNPGYLLIENNLNSHARTVNIVRHDATFPGATDGYDNGIDGITNSQPSGYPDIYSDITIHTLWDDFRAEDSNIPYDLRLSFSGSLPSTQSNWLEFSLPYDGVVPYGEYKFGNKPILLQSDRLPYGPVVDVRRVIAQNSGRIDLIDVPAGSYNQWTPYGTVTLDIGTRLLGDTNDSGHVDLGDFALIAIDWQKGSGQYDGDIAGPNGIPDGHVNYHDISVFSDDYLKDANDPTTW